METDRTTLQDTLEGMYDPDGVNINEDTLEELNTSHLKTKDTVNDQVIIDKTTCHTDVAKGPNSVDSKGLNCHDCKMRVHINKQSPDITKDVADDVHVDKGDLDDISAVPQRQISMIQTVQEIPQLQTVEKIAGTETSGLRQSAGMLQAREKQPENDVSGRVSESCEHFQFGAQFQDTGR